METNIQKLKSSLRAEVRARLKKLSDAQRASASAAACSLLEKQSCWQKARTILFYAPLAGEADVWRLVQDSLAAGKVVALPRHDLATDRYLACEVKNVDNDLSHGRFGIREPNDRCVAMPLNRLDLALVPGVAFDLRGRRLGRGKGFYDQLLAHVRGVTCGIAFDEQIVDEVPWEPHDVYLNCILTPTRWIEP